MVSKKISKISKKYLGIRQADGRLASKSPE
jgi:hypothetical protein